MGYAVTHPDDLVEGRRYRWRDVYGNEMLGTFTRLSTLGAIFVEIRSDDGVTYYVTWSALVKPLEELEQK